MLENLTTDDTIYLVLIVYTGYLLGRITDFIINDIDKWISEKKNNQKKEGK